MSLAETSDLYIPADRESVDQFYAFSAAQRLSSKNADWLNEPVHDIHSLLQQLNIDAGDDRYLLYKEFQYRVHLERRKSEQIFCLRRIPSFRPSLTDENPEGIVFPEITGKLVNEALKTRGGLYLVCGPLGAGKTTTSAALFNHILTTQGGVGWALENPPEYDLEGEYGPNGLAYQHSVENGDFAYSIRSMMRCYPAGAQSLMLIGEIRDSDTANEVFKALLNGTRVIATFHAGNAVEAITRLIAMAEQSGDYAKDILANSLRLLIAQQKRPSVSQGFKLHFDYLIANQSCKAAILNGSFESLKDIQAQQTNLRNSSRSLI